MKIISTNRWGFGIHSPFVFHLVTKVIFGKSGLSEDKISIHFTPDCREQNQLEMFTRMIEFFKPQKILVDNAYGFLQTIVRDKYRNGDIFMEKATKDSERYNWLHIGTGLPDLCCGSIENGVLILPDLQIKRCRELFINLQEDPGVTITIEVKRMGIVIYNCLYRKQNFLIRKWLL